MLTPPSRTIVTTVRVMPVAVSARALDKREVRITPLTYDGSTEVNPNLRQVTVTVRYLVDGAWRTYRLVSFVSSYS